MKIAILGYSGSGKSTTARILGEKFGIPVLHLDTVHFLENWQEREKDESRLIVERFMSENDSWVIDGNYKAFRQQQRLEQADRILFFNFNRFVCFLRIFSRWIKYRGKTRPDMAEGCNEKLDFRFAKWILYDGRTPAKQKSYNNMCKKYSNKVVILKNQRQLDSFFKSL